MANAADGYLGDWLPHKDKCRCTDCQLDRTQQKLAKLQRDNKALLEALKEALVLIEATYGRAGVEAGYWPEVKRIYAAIDAAIQQAESGRTE